MELINNTTKTLKDDLSVEIKKGSKLWNNQTLHVICNFHSKELPNILPEHFIRGKLLLCNYPNDNGLSLKPFEARMYLEEL